MIKARITIRHPNPEVLEKSLNPDNLDNMKTTTFDDTLTMTLETEKIGTMISTLDDWLANLKIAEEIAGKIKGG